jgi:hypothetical protein
MAAEILGLTGEGAPNVWGEMQLDAMSKLYKVVPCSEERGSRRQDGFAPLPFPQDMEMSQLWNEKCYIHNLRMMAIGLDTAFQQAVSDVTKRCNGQFRDCSIKGFVRMANKCISKKDHYYGHFP